MADLFSTPDAAQGRNRCLLIKPIIRLANSGISSFVYATKTHEADSYAVMPIIFSRA
jgi:hypothetical protein